MHTGADLVNDANLLQEEKGHDDYDFNDDDVENGNDDDGRFMQNAYWADLVDDANLLQEKGIKSFMITMMMMLRMMMMMTAAA